MLSLEAARLAAIEVLCPTAALFGEEGAVFPTLAGHRVFDSRAAAVAEIDDAVERGYAPILSLYTPDNQLERRGGAADASDNECEGTIEIVGELAVVSRDLDAEGAAIGDPYVDALAGSDPEARLVLAALLAQVRYLLEFSEAGHLFRRIIMAVRRITEKTYAIPELGLRWHRTTMLITVQARNDDFDMDEGGLPEPLKTLHSELPDGSYAKAKLEELGAHFRGETRTPLTTVTATDPAGVWPVLSIDIPQPPPEPEDDPE